MVPQSAEFFVPAHGGIVIELQGLPILIDEWGNAENIFQASFFISLFKICDKNRTSERDERQNVQGMHWREMDLRNRKRKESNWERE